MLKIGVLGAGHLGRIHMRLLAAIPDYQVAGFYDPDPEAATGGAVGRGAGKDAAAGRLRPHHRLRRQHARAGVHERDFDQPDA